jgi:hypothetical protein
MTHPEMTSFQSIAQNLLLETAASRVMLQLNAPGSGFLPAAEAVSHGARQIRHDAASGPVFDLPAIERAGGQDELLVQNDLLLDESPAASTLSNRYGVRSQVVAPLVHGGRLAGAIAVHHVGGATQWGDEEIAAVRRSQAGACRLLDERNRQVLSCSLESLRDAGIQALLDRVRSGLGVQRCTLRQNVSAAYAFPVTHESRRRFSVRTASRQSSPSIASGSCVRGPRRKPHWPVPRPGCWDCWLARRWRSGPARL